MIPVAEAQARILALLRPLPAEDVPLRSLAGRVLAGPVTALHDQPPFAASAMDGYAVAGGVPAVGDRFRVTGEAAAGHPFAGSVDAGEAVRIFTGAPVPDGAERVLIQEDVARDGAAIAVARDPGAQDHVRPAGGDFARGTAFDPGRRLGARDVALIAAMGHARVPAIRRPVVAILMTGDELRAPGTALGPGGITASNGYGLAVMVEARGAEARLLPIARDDRRHLAECLSLADGADLLLTVGGASVGDHDLVAAALVESGVTLDFHKVAMRPGKPLMAGRSAAMAVLGLPGNPVSALVCAQVFAAPMIDRMLGLGDAARPVPRPLAAAIEANGPRQHYMRARIEAGGAVHVAARQDSSLLSVLASSDCLVVRAPDDPARAAGETVETLPLDG